MRWIRIAVVVAVGCVAEPAAAAPPLSDEDGAIYRAIIEDGRSRYVVFDAHSSVIVVRRELSRWEHFPETVTELEDVMPDLQAQTLQSFHERNIEKGIVEASLFSAEDHVQVIDREEEHQLGMTCCSSDAPGCDPGWDGFRQQHPGAETVVQVSRPGWNAQRTQALAYWISQKECDYSDESVIELSRHGGSWRIVQVESLWPYSGPLAPRDRDQSQGPSARASAVQRARSRVALALDRKAVRRCATDVTLPDHGRPEPPHEYAWVVREDYNVLGWTRSLGYRDPPAYVGATEDQLRSARCRLAERYWRAWSAVYSARYRALVNGRKPELYELTANNEIAWAFQRQYGLDLAKRLQDAIPEFDSRLPVIPVPLDEQLSPSQQIDAALQAAIAAGQLHPVTPR